MRYRVFYKPEDIAEVHAREFTNTYAWWTFAENLEKSRAPFLTYEWVVDTSEWKVSESSRFHYMPNVIKMGIDSDQIPIIYHEKENQTKL